MSETILTAHGLNSTCPYALAEELDCVRQLTENLHGNSQVVMIGCGPAVFGLAIMESRRDPPEIQIIDHDPNQFHYASVHFERSDLFPMIADRIHYVEADSAALGEQWQRPVEFLLVDGDHSYEGVSADIEAWCPHVPAGCRIFFHDYLERAGGFNGIAEWEPGGCARAVEEAAQEGIFRVDELVGISAVCTKL